MHEALIPHVWSRVEVKAPTRCWLWRGVLNANGYGIFTIKRGVQVRAHRLVWEMMNGEIPAGLWVLHKCDVPTCVNPRHLFLGTPADNSVDMTRKGRAHRGYKLDDVDVREIRKLLDRGGVTQRSIAKRFGVSDVTISNIKHGLRFSRV